MFQTILRAANSTGPRTRSIDNGRQLFVDDELIAFTDMNRTFHQPVVSPNSPVMKPETELELNKGAMPATALFSDGLFFDPQDSLFKMWYMAGYDDALAYATSKDGIHWSRPELGIVDGTNRVLPQIPGFRRNGCTVWLDHFAKSPDERFKLFVYLRRTDGNWPRGEPNPLPDVPEKGHNYTSPDGIHWTFRGETGPCGDNSGMFYNGLSHKWVYTVRTNTPGFGRTRSFVTKDDFAGDPMWSTSDVRLVATADRLDRPDPELGYRPELYKLDCVTYESLVIGLFGIYFGPPNEIAYGEGYPKTLDLFLGTSRDGITWDRSSRQPFLRCSRKPGTWDKGYLHAAGGICLVIGDELRFYYTGFAGDSPAQGGGPYATATIGYATLRRDGFASIDGPGMVMRRVSGPSDPTPLPIAAERLAGGVLITKPVTFSGKRVFVNADIKPAGTLAVALLDVDGQPIDGFGFADCLPIKGNSTRHAVAWRGNAEVSRLAGRGVRLAFTLDSGSIYSFWVSASDSGASNGFVAAGGPGFTGATDTTGA